MSENLFEVLLTLIPVLGAVLTYFIVPFLKARIETAKLEQYRQWADLAVKAAEMIWTETGHGPDKKRYVVQFLDKLLNGKKTVVTEEQLQVLIEAAVTQMKQL